MNILKKSIAVCSFFLVAACTGQPIEPIDYTAFRDSAPRSILVLPVVNSSNEAEAADFFLTTAPIPLAEKGYYVFPINMVKKSMENDGLADAAMVHAADPTRVGELFGADMILYVEILEWDAKYALISSGIKVSFKYKLVDAKSGGDLWHNTATYIHDTSGNSGNIFIDLVATAITAAANNMRSDYTGLAVNANNMAFITPSRGIPAGPHSPQFGLDIEAFPKTGSGWKGEPRETGKE